ncbi:MAG TPA: class I adenylate-forming enzyme family protein [Candidatus Limnocylindria bacterium]|nr:class I adenylate-forming enzyme family protein [Candidatus Limnocylindria bacterium]
MLYDRWREIAREHSGEIALRDLPSTRQWTFAELDAAAQTRESEEAVVYPRGNGAEFVISVLRAWRHGQITCPLEGNQALPAFPKPPSHIAHLKMTSATSGPPKLVAFNAPQIAADADNIVATMKLRRDWPNLAFISLAHSYGFSNLITPLLLHGIPLILGGVPFPEIVRAAGEQFASITLPAVPALWRAWHDAGAIPKSVRLAISAGAPLPLALEQEIFCQHALKVHNFYGASECGGIAYDATDVPRDDPACVGTAMVNVSLEINSGGCLEVRGRNVGEGYWPACVCSLADSAYVTTDLAELRDGAVFLRGRVSDVINVAGRKVSPECIEEILAAHAAVQDCLVFGIPSSDAQRGESIVACVVASNGTSPSELRQFMLAQTESWHVPREFWFVDSLEANQRGKLSRAEWRARFMRQGDTGGHAERSDR